MGQPPNYEGQNNGVGYPTPYPTYGPSPTYSPSPTPTSYPTYRPSPTPTSYPTYEPSPTSDPYATPTPTRSPDADCQPDAVIRSTNGYEPLGGNVYNTDGEGQTVAGGTVPGQKLTFIVTLENDGQVADRLKLSGPIQSGTWSLKYFDNAEGGSDISAHVGAEGWSVPSPLNPYDSREIRVEITPGAGTVPGSGPIIPLTAASGSSARRDVVKIDTRFQKLAGIEYSLDAEETWQAVPSGVGFITVEQNQVLSFRAVKGDADGEWPFVPGHYVVQWIGGHFRHHGEVTSVTFEAPTLGDAVETVTADGGNTLSARVKVLAPSNQ